MSNWDNNARRKSNKFIIFDDHVVVRDDRGFEFIVDHKGYQMILEFDRYWFVNQRMNGKEPYVSTKYNNKHIQLHNFLMNPSDGFVVDHIDGDKTNNRFSNLRIVTEQQNAMNKGIQHNNTSGVKGVHKVKRSGKWQARISYKGKRIVLGTFVNFDDAVKARQEAENFYYGEFNRKQGGVSR